MVSLGDMTRVKLSSNVNQGPSGTGKTSTISAAVREWVRAGSSAWIVAQSNVAVKNIAEKLSKDHVTFRVLVSRAFVVNVFPGRLWY